MMSDKALIMKRRTTIYVDPKLWDDFMKYIIEKHGKTHGGVISDEVENAIKLMIKKEPKR
jgi:hypothetical protein